MPLEIGSLLNDRYRIDRILGQGGMGAVYLATDESLGVPCAVKENLNISHESARMFRREAGLLASLRHPNLPRVTNHFILGDHQYLVMDYIEGEDLRQRLRRDGPLPERLVLAWALQLCDILIYLHSRNPPVVHRDIKPANIKLTPAGDIALVDFGVAKPIAPDQTTATPAVAFTPGFTPPEQYGLRPVDGRADQYALGATLYTLLTGQLPPDGKLRYLSNATPIQPQALRPDLSSGTAAALTRALAIMPEDRFSDAAAFKAALQGRAGLSPDAGGQNRGAAAPSDETKLPRQAQPAGPVGPPSRAAGPSPAARPPKPATAPPPPASTGPGAAPARQGPSVWVLLGGIGCLVLVVAVALGGFGVLGYMLNRPTATPTAAPSAISTLASATPAEADLSPTPLLAFTDTPPAPSETPAPETATRPAPTTPANTATTPPPVRTPTPSATPTPAGTPIGKGARLAFISNRDGKFYQIYTMNPDGGDARQVTTDPVNKWDPKWPFNGTQLAWSPDGRQLLYVAESVAGDGTDIFMVNADGSNPMDLTSAPSDDFQPAWCSDGSIWFASTRVNGVQQIFHTDLKSIGKGFKPINFSATHNSPREYDPTLYPGCQRVLFVTTLNGAPELWQYWPDCSKCYGPIRSAKAQGGKADEPALSADGKSVAYTQSLPGSVQVMVGLVADHTVTMQLTTTGANSEAEWSPDGQWLAFVSTRDGNRRIYRMTRTGANQTDLTDDPFTDTDPVWQPAP